MFKQLRNKFLILNLSIISVLMLIAFAAIYFITYNNVFNAIDMELHKLDDSKRPPSYKNDSPPPAFDSPLPPPERSVFFALIVDKEGTLIDSASFFEIDGDLLEEAKNSALAQNTSKGKFKLEGNYWAFLISPYFTGYRILFLDITSRQAILTNLIYTFAVVAFFMLIIIFFISRFFANKSIQPIQEAFIKQEQFITDASHELKTPLAVINTNVDVLLANKEDTIGQQEKWLQYIKSEVARMSKLTNDLLYLTQIDHSHLKNQAIPFNLSATVENVILTMEAIIFENNIDFHYDLQPDLQCHGNNEQLKQVVMILLDNAVKYANNHGVINLSLKQHNNFLLLSVTNSGEGIPPEHITKIFDRFYRTDKSRTRKSGGYGLGLFIAKAIVEQHGGKISAQSIPGESTTFTVKLLHKVD